MPNQEFTDDVVLSRPDVPGGRVQELIIERDGSIRVPWISPPASDLIMAVWQALRREPFPVKPVSGNLYCG
jgi:hypothetical protein